ncbi:MAG TPA: type II secretion system protein GspM [Symbiobacteriaceae bacterium]|jgi:hypothetical protein
MALSQREKALVAVPVLLAGVMGLYYWVHEPLLAHRAAAQELADKTGADLKTQQGKLSKEGDLKSRLAAVTAREQTIDAWVPGKNSAAMFIWYLSQAEARSGVKVRGLTVGERKEVQAVPAGQPGGTKAPAGAVPTLTVIQLDLKLDGRFADHLLFNQELEGTPLFLSTDALELQPSPETKSPVDKVSQFIQDGNAWMAAQTLGLNPTLNGAYQIKLYFKGVKVGPATDSMQFAQPTGRTDPFVMDNIDEFLQALIDYYSGTLGGSKTGPGTTNPPAVDPGKVHSQMG